MGIKKFILKNTVFKKRLKLLKDKKELYKTMVEPKDIYEYQLNKFNLMWENAYNNIPFYTMWKEKYNLPSKIKSIEEIKDFPILTKKDIQQNQDLIFNHLKNYKTLSTGGSTGEPTKFPYMQFEMEERWASAYVARNWWSIKPLDAILLFWGHSHLFGTGLKGKINQFKRVVADWLINTKRLNAYDMSIDTLEKYYQDVKKSNPKSIFGYTSSIYKLAKYIDDNNLDIGDKSNLKAVIVTSETVTSSDVKLIEKIFKVPCVSEYGLAELGIVSYSHNSSNNIDIMWDLFIATKSENNILNITTLYDKKFALINYNTDDTVSILEEYKSSLIRLNSIDGRVQDVLNIQTIDNKVLSLSGILMIHILKGFPNIYEISFKQLLNNKIKISIVSDKEVDLKTIKKFFIDIIKKDHPTLNGECVFIEQIEEVTKTVAGKTQLISEGI